MVATCYFACKRTLPLNGLEGQIFKASSYVGISITETRLKSYQEGMILNQSFIGSANILPEVGARSYFCRGCRSFKSDNGAPRWVILARISRNHTKKGMITYKLTTGRYDFKNGLSVTGIIIPFRYDGPGAYNSALQISSKISLRHYAEPYLLTTAPPTIQSLSKQHQEYYDNLWSHYIPEDIICHVVDTKISYV